MEKGNFFKKLLVIVIILCAFSLAERIVDGVVEIEKLSMQQNVLYQEGEN